MPTRPTGILIALALATPAVAVAQRADSTSLPAVVVTATRTPTPITATTQPVTVLSGETLRARGLTSVADALREVPGVAVAQSGSPGAVTSLFMRGGESRYTKVLVDGVAVNTVGGTVFLQNITLDNVERIEIVQGPTSALYGADAMAGVVQIFTRRGTSPGADVAVDGGTYGTRDASASLRGAAAGVDLSIGGGWHHTDGLAAFNNGYSNGTLSAAAGVALWSGASVRATSRYTGAVYHFPTDFAGNVGDTNSYTREHRLVVGMDARQALGPVTLRLFGGDMEVHGLSEDRQRMETAITDFSTSHDRSYGARRTLDARAQLALGRAGLLTLGVPYERETETTEQRDRMVSYHGDTTSSTSSSAGTRTAHGVYAAIQGTPLTWLSYDASARHDDHSDYRSVTTYHAGVSAAPWSGGRVRASYGTGFNAPAFYETLGSAYNLPNRALQPEQARTIDVGVEQSLLDSRVTLSAGAFDQHFTQLIQYTVFPGPTDGQSDAIYENLTAARAHGYSGGVTAALAPGLTASADYTQTIARVVSIPPGYQGAERPGDALLRRPSHSGSAALTYARDGWSGAAMLSYVGARPDLDFQKYPSPTVALPAYARLDLSASVPVLHRDGSGVALTARVQNALGRRYDEIAHFPAPGRTILLGVRVTAAP